MKEAPSEHFRWAPHTGGLAVLKTKDYDVADAIHAANPYEAWKIMAEEGRPLRPGDLLEVCDGERDPQPVPAAMWIAKYVGFERAQWFVPEPPTGTVPASDVPAVSESCSS